RLRRGAERDQGWSGASGLSPSWEGESGCRVEPRRSPVRASRVYSEGGLSPESPRDIRNGSSHDWAMVLSLQILGGLQARLDGEPLAARAAQRKRLALLCLLATARGRSLARDRHQLAATTHDIRRAIASELLIAEADELRLNPALVECDLWDFEAALERGDAGEAVARYGGPLLDGFHVAGARELEQWIEDERARLARRFAT